MVYLQNKPRNPLKNQNGPNLLAETASHCYIVLLQVCYTSVYSLCGGDDASGSGRVLVVLVVVVVGF